MMTLEQKQALVEQTYVQLRHAIMSDEEAVSMRHFNSVRNLIQELHFDVWTNFQKGSQREPAKLRRTTYEVR